MSKHAKSCDKSSFSSMDCTCQHTPGPWEAIHDFDGDYGIFPKDRRESGPLATTYTDRAEDAHNARLMAASPMLLEALNRMLVAFAGQDEELCMECGGQIGKCEECETCYVIGKAIEAIALAKGEKP
jgi:hypothetical protein